MIKLGEPEGEPDLSAQGIFADKSPSAQYRDHYLLSTGQIGPS